MFAFIVLFCFYCRLSCVSSTKRIHRADLRLDIGIGEEIGEIEGGIEDIIEEDEYGGQLDIDYVRNWLLEQSRQSLSLERRGPLITM